MRAVITGATKGIGKAIAIKLAKNGFDLVLLARNESSLNDLKNNLLQYDNNILTYPVNCANKNEVLSFIKKADVDFEFADVLINNVGVFNPGLLLDEDDDLYEKQQNINLNTAYYLSKYFGKKMREAKKGHVFTICSVASKVAVANAGSYSVTKAALLSLNNVLRQELAIHNVKVTAFLPGSTKTSSWEGTEIPDEKFIQPEDIAETLYTILNLSKGVNVDEVLLTPLNF
jgi:short-subunit dehydrogenase